MAEFNLSRAGRKNQIVLLFQRQAKHSNRREMSATEVARGIGMKPSWLVRQYLAECVRDGMLQARAEALRGGQLFTFAANGERVQGASFKMIYSLSRAGMDQLIGRARIIPVKVAGRPAGQLRLL